MEIKITNWYKNENNQFIKIGENIYYIHFVKTKSSTIFYIVVNSFLTTQKIDLSFKTFPFRQKIFNGIKEYKNSNKEKTNNNILNVNDLKSIFKSKKILNVITNHLEKINKIESRDELTKYYLI